MFRPTGAVAPRSLARCCAASLTALATALASCPAARTESAQCVYSDQCAAGLVCAGGACRAACRTDRDCAGGAQCLAAGAPDAAARACVPPGAPAPCLYARDCTRPGEVCARDGVCRAQCRADRDCAVRAPWLAGAACNPDGVCTVAAVSAGMAPRPIAPLPGLQLPLTAPTVRFERAAGDSSTVRVEVCRDRACSAPMMAVDVPPTNGQTGLRLPASGVWFWRLRRIVGGVPEAQTSATWFFTARASPVVAPDRWELPRLDTNNDGAPDVVTSAPGADASGPLLFAFGGSPTGVGGLLNDPVWRNAPDASRDPLGTEMVAFDDVNGDGRTDLLALGGASQTLHLFLGGPAGLSQPSIVLLPHAVHVAGAGNFNEDSASDLVVTPSLGSVELLYGTPGGTTPASPTTVTPPTSATGSYGSALAHLGDVNADGLDDIAVGDIGGNGGAGAAYLLLGAMTGQPVERAQPMQGDVTLSAQFGNVIAGVGDVNGDGYRDIVVAGAQARAQLPVYLFAGSATGVGQRVTLLLPGADPLAVVGALEGLGDVNRDGYADFAVSTHDSGGGHVFVYRGGRFDVSGAPPTRIEPLPSDSTFGFALSGPGDLDNDGYDDLVVSAPGPEQLTVYRGTMNGTMTVTARIVPSPVLSMRTFGFALAP